MKASLIDSYWSAVPFTLNSSPPVEPIFVTPSNSFSYSTMTSSGLFESKVFASSVASNPISFPKLIFIRESKIFSLSTTYAVLILPLFISASMRFKFFKNWFSSMSPFLISFLTMPSLYPPLSSEVVTSFLSPYPTAKLMSVGGTWRFSKLPLIESFPPIGGVCVRFEAFIAPKRAMKGFCHFSGASSSFSKYSWYERRIVLRGAPVATAFNTEIKTA